MRALEQQVVRPFFPAFLVPRPRLQHAVRRNDVGNGGSSTSSRGFEKRRLPEAVEVGESVPARAEIWLGGGSGLSLDNHAGAAQITGEGIYREIEAAHFLAGRRLEKMEGHWKKQKFSRQKAEMLKC